MDQKKIDRINALARKARTPEGLTQEELQERDALRKEYVAAFKASLTAQLDRTYIQYPTAAGESWRKSRVPNKIFI